MYETAWILLLLHSHKSGLKCIFMVQVCAPVFSSYNYSNCVLNFERFQNVGDLQHGTVPELPLCRPTWSTRAAALIICCSCYAFCERGQRPAVITERSMQMSEIKMSD